MYINKCSKCGKEFETKNPKRVICPECLYPDRSPLLQNNSDGGNGEQPKQETENKEKEAPITSYSSGGDDRPQNNYNSHDGEFRSNRDGFHHDRGGYNHQGGYNRQGGGFNRQGGGYNRGGQGGYNRQGGGFNRQGGFNRNGQGGHGGGFNRGGQGGGFRRPNGGRNFNKRPAKKALLVSREQVAMIEVLYKRMLPLPNPDAHEVIGAEIGLEPNKVFFGINLVRQKMMLPKLPFPKRKLAITPDQMFAIQNLYEPLLPLPPIGCHKIIAAQLKMDEWRVHVGIGLIRAKLGLGRWNEDRADAPEEFKNKSQEDKAEKKSSKTAKEKKSDEPETEKKTRKTTKKAKADNDEE